MRRAPESSDVTRERFELARSQFEKALARLREAVAQDETELVRDALIQRFEFTYELGWKCMFYWLRMQKEKVPEVVRQVLQAAFRAELITDAELWERIKDYRDETSHTYDEKKAIEVAAFVRSQAVQGFETLLAKLATL
jgi:nucleotidyltransferase substrate binding protein (TIGR01987 family)